MIPQKKKTTEEMAALREGLGILPSMPAPVTRLASAEPMTELFGEMEEDQIESLAPAAEPDTEPVIHLELPPMSPRQRKMEIKPAHSLRKHDLPLSPATEPRNRTALPKRRHDSSDIAKIRKREALSTTQLKRRSDPAAHIRKQIASPFLYIPGYLLTLAAVVTAYKRVHYITPAGLIVLATLIMVFIVWRKPRSRHHAALLFIAVFLTLVFGALHYAPLFQNGP